MRPITAALLLPFLLTACGKEAPAPKLSVAPSVAPSGDVAKLAPADVSATGAGEDAAPAAPVTSDAAVAQQDTAEPAVAPDPKADPSVALAELKARGGKGAPPLKDGDDVAYSKLAIAYVNDVWLPVMDSGDSKTYEGLIGDDFTGMRDQPKGPPTSHAKAEWLSVRVPPVAPGTRIHLGMPAIEAVPGPYLALRVTFQEQTVQAERCIVGMRELNLRSQDGETSLHSEQLHGPKPCPDDGKGSLAGTHEKLRLAAKDFDRQDLATMIEAPILIRDHALINGSISLASIDAPGHWVLALIAGVEAEFENTDAEGPVGAVRHPDGPHLVYTHRAGAWRLAEISRGQRLRWSPPPVKEYPTSPEEPE